MRRIGHHHIRILNACIVSSLAIHSIAESSCRPAPGRSRPRHAPAAVDYSSLRAMLGDPPPVRTRHPIVARGSSTRALNSQKLSGNGDWLPDVVLRRRSSHRMYGACPRFRIASQLSALDFCNAPLPDGANLRKSLEPQLRAPTAFAPKRSARNFAPPTKGVAKFPPGRHDSLSIHHATHPPTEARNPSPLAMRNQFLTKGFCSDARLCNTDAVRCVVPP